jgi:hypothetical protein
MAASSASWRTESEYRRVAHRPDKPHIIDRLGVAPSAGSRAHRLQLAHGRLNVRIIRQPEDFQEASASVAPRASRRTAYSNPQVPPSSRHTREPRQTCSPAGPCRALRHARHTGLQRNAHAHNLGAKLGIQMHHRIRKLGHHKVLVPEPCTPASRSRTRSRPVPELAEAAFPAPARTLQSA